MEKTTNSIKNPKVRAYFEDVTEKRKPVGKLTADELEEGVSQFIDGLDKAMSEVDELVFRTKLGDMPEALSFSYIAQKYFGKSRAWLMQKINGNTVNGKTASFTDGERQQFREALEDLSKRISAVAMAI